MSIEPTTLDARHLKALGHPVRLAIVEHLGQRGELTATALAELVGESPSNCSWHLRRLADAGLVEPGTTGDGRQRPWRLAFSALDLDQASFHSPVPRQMVLRQVERMLAAFADPRGREVAGASDTAWLTPEEVSRIAERLEALVPLVPDAQQRRDDPSARPEDAQPYEFMGWLFPVGDPR